MRNRLELAVARRGDAAMPAATVCRLVAGDADQLPGLILDRIGHFAFATSRDLSIDHAPIAALCERLGLRGLSLRGRQKGGQGVQIFGWGEPLPEHILIREGAIAVDLRIHPQSLSYGLFPDLRNERLRLAGAVTDKSLLNLYAYTGLFGVHAAVGGATRVVQVDALRSMLRQISTNEALNKISCERVCDDALAYCRRAARRGDLFDLVVHDPPTFGRDPKGRTRSTRSALPEMLASALSAVVDGGLLLSIVNTATMGEERVEEAHILAAASALCRIKKEAGLEIARDAPSPLKGGWYRVRRG
jgi:23S rRNA (cytosine1962-C5)-methyltransferase